MELIPSNLPHGDKYQQKLRYLYMLSVDNFGKKSKFYGKEKIYYTGTTTSLGRRMNQHLYRAGSNFLRYYFPDSRKIIVYVEYLFGNEEEATAREKKIKRMPVWAKEELVKSRKNILKRYIPLKVIILKKYEAIEEEVLIRL